LSASYQASGTMGGRYEVEFSDTAKGHLKAIERSGRKTDLKKLHRFTQEVEAHPRSGTGEPERMKHCAVETWSRRVNQKDRFVYEIYGEEMRIVVKQASGHYADK